MRVVIDNNVIIDALKPNTQFEAEAIEILHLAAKRKFDGFVSANSLTDIFYILRKSHGSEKANAMLKNLLLILDIIAVKSDDCVNALELAMPDFEDALIATCAAKTGASCIISRDRDFTRAKSPVKVISPSEFLRKYR